MGHDKYMEFALQKLREHDYGHLEYRFVAVIAKGGRVLSVGFNSGRKHGLIETFRQPDECWTNVHAECDAVLRARRKIDLRGSKVYVARMTVDGSVRGACPCPMCQRVLALYGVRRAYFTLDSGATGSMKIVPK